MWDATDHWPPIGFVFKISFFFAIGVLMLAGGKLSFVRELMPNDVSRKALGVMFVGFTSFMLSITVWTMFDEWRAVTADAREVVAGPVESFDPMKFEGHGSESFSVKGVWFSYSDYGPSSALNNTRSHGGPDLEGRVVRVEYVYRNNKNLIARLEVACRTSEAAEESSRRARR